MNPTPSVAGEVVVVTGGASGIGAACARRFLELGAHVLIADRQSVEGAPAVDVTDEASLAAFAQWVGQQHDQIHHLVLAAGMVPDKAAPLIGSSMELWERVLRVNLEGLLLSVRALDHLLRGPGTITVITSGEQQHATIGNGAYCVSKAGAWMLTKMLALELAPRSIRVNAVSPGFIETPMTAPFLDRPQRREKLAANTPLGRIGEVDDIASAVVYLAGSDASFITGISLPVDGGIATNER